MRGRRGRARGPGPAAGAAGRPGGASTASWRSSASTDMPFLHPRFVAARLRRRRATPTPRCRTSAASASRSPRPTGPRSRRSSRELVAAGRMKPAFLFERCDDALAATTSRIPRASRNLNDARRLRGRARRAAAGRATCAASARCARPAAPTCARRRSARAAAAVGVDARRARARRAQRRPDRPRPARAARRGRRASPSWPLTPEAERGGEYSGSMAPGGYFGRALVVDLDDGEQHRRSPLPEQVLRDYGRRRRARSLAAGSTWHPPRRGPRSPRRPRWRSSSHHWSAPRSRPAPSSRSSPSRR